MRILRAIARWVSTAPKTIQWFIGLGMAIAIVLLPTIVVIQTLRDGSLQSTLGFDPPTKQDLSAVADTLEQAITAKNAVGLQSLRDSLRTVDSTMRADYLDPGVAILKDLVDRVESIEASQGEAQHSLRNISTTSAAQLRQLEEMAQDDTRLQLIDKLDAMQRQVEALRDSLNAKPTPTPGKRLPRKTF